MLTLSALSQQFRSMSLRSPIPTGIPLGLFLRDGPFVEGIFSWGKRLFYPDPIINISPLGEPGRKILIPCTDENWVWPFLNRLRLPRTVTPGKCWMSCIQRPVICQLRRTLHPLDGNLVECELRLFRGLGCMWMNAVGWIRLGCGRHVGTMGWFFPWVTSKWMNGWEF